MFRATRFRNAAFVLCLISTSLALVAFRQAVVSSQTGLVDDFRHVEAASVADAIEQLYKKRAYMSHDMRSSHQLSSPDRP